MAIYHGIYTKYCYIVPVGLNNREKTRTYFWNMDGNVRGEAVVSGQRPHMVSWGTQVLALIICKS